jgi:energy-coupling factor transporter transmembrane protein EcfT
MHGNDGVFFIIPLLAIFFILRRGFRQSRVRPGALFVYPLIICLLIAATFVHQKMPTPEMMAVLAVAALVGLGLGWFTTAQLQLSVDAKSGTILSKPTPIGTAITAAVFALRFAVDYMMRADAGGAHAHDPLLLAAANAGLMFVAGRLIGRAVHLWIRTRPLLAAQVVEK